MSKNLWRGLILTLGAWILFVVVLAARQRESASPASQLAKYDTAREVTLLGTVQNYTAAYQTPPLGPRVILQTSAGLVDVHLGDARLLAANHFTVQAGDSLRIIGENVSYGNKTQFVARVIQKGNQAIQVRSVRGIRLSYAAPRSASLPKGQGGVL